MTGAGPDAESRSDRIEALLALAGRLHLVRQPADRDTLLDRLARPARPFILAFANAHAINLAWRDRALRDALLGADMVLRDGAGMALLCRRLGRDPGLNLNGTDLIPDILDRFRGRRVVLIGTQEPWLGGAAAWAAARGISVVATADGFRPADAYEAFVAEARPDLILLGLGMPRQEQLARRLAAALGPHPCLIVNGGAILDFWAGRFPRAPGWMRRAGLEWLYRLSREPVRLWTRYVIGNPLFMLRAQALARAARDRDSGKAGH